MISGYWAANVALLSGPQRTLVTLPLLPISTSRNDHITRRPALVGGLMLVT